MKAYRCDCCDEFFDGTPMILGRAATLDNSQRVMAVLELCWWCHKRCEKDKEGIERRREARR